MTRLKGPKIGLGAILFVVSIRILRTKLILLGIRKPFGGSGGGGGIEALCIIVWGSGGGGGGGTYSACEFEVATLS